MFRWRLIDVCVTALKRNKKSIENRFVKTIKIFLKQVIIIYNEYFFILYNIEFFFGYNRVGYLFIWTFKNIMKLF